MDVTREQVLAALGEVIDPEVGLDVVSLGLVYGVQLQGGSVRVDLTMTTPACPMGDQIVQQAVTAVQAVPGAEDVEVRLVWDPPWTPDRMSEAAKDTLGWGR